MVIFVTSATCCTSVCCSEAIVVLRLAMFVASFADVVCKLARLPLAARFLLVLSKAVDIAVTSAAPFDSAAQRSVSLVKEDGSAFKFARAVTYSLI